MTAEQPKISVCIATYNQQNYIEECLLSVLNQQCDADVEVLVGNDCSVDATGAVIDKIARRHPGRVHVPFRSGNLGSSRNYQDLVSRSTGDYIAHLDGDDYWLPGKLATQLAFMRANPQCAAVYTNALVVEENGREIGVFNNEQPEIFDTEYLLRCGNFLNYSSVLYHARFKGAVLEIAEEFIDYRMHIRLARRGKLGYINRHMVCYRKDSSTSMLKNASEKVLRLYWQALRDTGRDAAGRHQGMARFLATVVSSKIGAWRFEQAIQWGRLIRKEVHGCVFCVFAMGALELARHLLRKLVRGMFSRNRPLVLFKR